MDEKSASSIAVMDIPLPCWLAKVRISCHKRIGQKSDSRAMSGFEWGPTSRVGQIPEAIVRHMCWSVMNVDQHGKSAISRWCSYPNSIPIRCPAILVGGWGAKKHSWEEHWSFICKMSRHGCAIGKPCIVSTPCVLPEIPVWSKRLVWWDSLVRRLMDRRVQPPLEASTYCEWWIPYCWTPWFPHALHGCCPCCRHSCWRSLWYGSTWGTKRPTESIRQHQLIPIDRVECKCNNILEQKLLQLVDA